MLHTSLQYIINSNIAIRTIGVLVICSHYFPYVRKSICKVVDNSNTQIVVGIVIKLSLTIPICRILIAMVVVIPSLLDPPSIHEHGVLPIGFSTRTIFWNMGGPRLLWFLLFIIPITALVFLFICSYYTVFVTSCQNCD